MYVHPFQVPSSVLPFWAYFWKRLACLPWWITASFWLVRGRWDQCTSTLNLNHTLQGWCAACQQPMLLCGPLKQFHITAVPLAHGVVPIRGNLKDVAAVISPLPASEKSWVPDSLWKESSGVGRVTLGHGGSSPVGLRAVGGSQHHWGLTWVT